MYHRYEIFIVFSHPLKLSNYR